MGKGGKRVNDLFLTHRFVNSPRAGTENMRESRAGPVSEADKGQMREQTPIIVNDGKRVKP